MSDQNEDIEIDIEGEDDLEIEVQDDTPEKDRGKPKATEVEPEPKAAAGADDDDLEGYSESVKKRINKLKFDYHAERRAKEEAARLREEAINYAEKIRKENEELRKAYAEGESVLVNQTKARVESELTRAKAEYKSAYEAGDADAVLAAQEKLIKLQNEHDRVANYRPRGAQDVAPAPAKAAAPQAAPKIPKPDEKAVKWAEQNEWFMKDKAMTGYVMGVHEDLVGQGIDPTSDLYYSKIDAAVRRTFPDKFEDGSIEEKAPRRQAGPVVAPAVRSSKAPRKIVLTSTEVALAKRLGVPLKVFAAQKLKDSQNG
jgi:hypothetical protein